MIRNSILLPFAAGLFLLFSCKEPKNAAGTVAGTTKKINKAESWQPTWDTAPEDTAIILYRLKINTTGTGKLGISMLQLDLTGTTDLKDIDYLSVYYGDGSERIREDDTYFFPTAANRQNTFPVKPATGQISVPVTTALKAGDNYLYIACKLKSSSTEGHQLSANISSIQLSDGKQYTDIPRQDGKRRVVRLMPINKNYPKTLSHTVFGYSAWFNIYEGKEKFTPYELLHYITVSGFDVNKNTGALIPQGDAWPYIEVYNKAHEKNTKVLLCVATAAKDVNNSIFNNELVRNNLYQQIAATIQQFYLDGVNLNFEEFNESDKGAPFTNFVKGLSEYMTQTIPGKELIITTYGRDLEGRFEMAALAGYASFLLPQEYNYHGSWGGGGANSPLQQVYNDLESFKGVPKSKIVPMFPYFGNRWTADNKYVDVKHYGWLYNAIKDKKFSDLKRTWDATSQTPYYTFTENGKPYQLWVDDSTSLALKFQRAKELGYKGVGCYAVGYDWDSPDYWNVIRKAFSK